MHKHLARMLQACLTVFALICFSSASSCSTTTHYLALPIAFDSNKLVGSWMGLNDLDSSIYKLLLKGDGTGVMYWQFDGGTATTNWISRWQVNDEVLHCEFQDHRSPQSLAVLNCQITTSLLKATLTGVGGWEENVNFRFFREVCV